MPVYEYRCNKCDDKFELLRGISQANEDATCPKCHKTAKKVLSKFMSYSKSGNLTTPIAGTTNSCSGCSSSSCSTCH